MNTCEENNEEDQSTLETILDRIGIGKYHYRTYACLFINTMSEGASMLAMTFLNYILMYVYWFKDIDEISMIGSAVFIGSSIGGIIAGGISDRYGRKFTFITSAFIVGFSGLTSAFSPNMMFLTIARGVFGFGFGMMVPPAISYGTEITPKKYRGLDYITLATGFGIGQLVGLLIGYLLEVDKYGSDSWRMMLIWDGIPGILSAVIFWWLQYESPRFELLRDPKRGLEILNGMHHINHGTDLVLTNEERQEIDSWIARQHEKRIEPSVKDLFTNGWWRITLPVWGICFTQNTIYYGNLFIYPLVVAAIKSADAENAGQPEPTPSGLPYFGILTLVLSDIPAQLMAAFLVQRKEYGRKKSMIFFYVVEVILTMAIFFGPHLTGYLAPVLKILGSCSYSLLGTFVSELYHTKIRSTAIGYANGIDRLGGTVMPTILLHSLNIAPTGPYLILGVYAFIAMTFCLLLKYDTTFRDLDKGHNEEGKELVQEMQEYKKL